MHKIPSQMLQALDDNPERWFELNDANFITQDADEKRMNPFFRFTCN